MTTKLAENQVQYLSVYLSIAKYGIINDNILHTVNVLPPKKHTLMKTQSQSCY